MLLPNPGAKWDAQAEAAARSIIMQADAQNLKRGRPAETGALTVAGAASVSGNLSTGGDLSVTGAASVTGDLSVAAASVNGALTVNGAEDIQQGGSDGFILTMKSTDVAHGMTDLATTDTYAGYSKISPTGGGVVVTGLGSTVGILLRGAATTENTTKSTAAAAAVEARGATKSGTGVGNMGTNVNLFAVRNNTTTRFILDGDGDSHQDVGTAWTNFDTHDDVALLNLMSAHVTRPEDPLRESFHEWLEQSRDELERVRLVSFNGDGHHFVNMSRLTMLLTGAVRQLGARLERTEELLQKALAAGAQGTLPGQAAPTGPNA